MKHLKKTIINIINAVSIAAIILAVAVLATVFMTKNGEAPSFAGYSLFTVMTGSMEPELPVGSLVAVKKCEPSEINAGDIISFYSRDPSISGSVNTHRVLETRNENGQYQFMTKGDANAAPDKDITYGQDVIGKVVFRSVSLGKIIHLTSNPLIFFPLIIVPLLIILISNIVTTVRIAKDISREELEGGISGPDGHSVTDPNDIPENHHGSSERIN
ncbi:MAG: signal peptidase I [Eubacteriales bacterium]|nr:signal peptidase I [Eubacteriales bacterium]